MAAAPQEQIIQKPVRSPFESTLLGVSILLLLGSCYLLSKQIGFYLRPGDVPTLQNNENVAEVESRKAFKALDDLETTRNKPAAKPGQGG